MALYHYDLHIHSALSPCAEKDMTPVTIVGLGKMNGLDFIAVSDHNSIKNVEVAMKAGDFYGIKVVPAMELQTNEDIHILCLFRTFEDLEGFYNSIEFSQRENRPEIFGEQQIMDEDDNIIGYEKTMLLDSAKISSTEVPALAKKYRGIAIPAHIDREANSMLQILGSILKDFTTVEFSTKATEADMVGYDKKYNIIVDSDSHVLQTISFRNAIELEEYSVDCLIDTLSKPKE